MTNRFRTTVRRPMRLEAFSVLARSLRHAVYNHEAPAGQPNMWRLHHDLQTISKSGRPEWLYNDRLHVATAGNTAVVVVDMRNSQFIGADISLPTFSLGYEPDIGIAIDACVPDDGVLLDVGANWGYFSLFLAVRPGFHGQVLAMEPFPQSFESLRKVVSGVGVEGLVEAIPLAAGRAAGRAAMSDEMFSGNNRIVSDAAAVEIERTTIDKIVAERGLVRVDFIKIDVEGAEADAIAGARDTLLQYAPAVMFEDWFTPGDPAAAFDALEAIAPHDYFVIDVRKPFRRGVAGEADALASAVDCLATVESLTPAERDHWPDRINVLALPAGSDALAKWKRREAP